MEFSLEELQTTLEEMGFKDVPSDHLHLFAKGYYSYYTNLFSNFFLFYI